MAWVTHQPYPSGPPMAGYPPAQNYYSAPPQPVAPNGRPLGGLGRRYVARMIDQGLQLVAMGASLGPFVFLLYQVAGEPSTTTGSGTRLTTVGSIVWVTALITVPLAVLYLHKVELCLRLGGQTIGKRWMGIAIAPLDPRVPLTRTMLLRRGVVDVLFGLLSVIYLGLINLLWALWDKPYRQCLHDKAGHTVVVSAR